MDDFSTLGQRIKYGLEKSGKTQADLSRYTGIKTATVSQWCSDKVKALKSDNALNVSRFLSVDYNWLVTGKGSPVPQQEENISTQIISEENSTYTTIPYKRISFQCGEGYEPSYEELLDETFLKLENKFFVENQVSPNHCICVKAEGNSMEPLIYDGEYVVIDQNQRTDIKEGCVYAFGVQGKMKIKRLYPKIDGSLIIKSENKNFGDDHVPPELMDSVVIIGRVIARIGTAPFK